MRIRTDFMGRKPDGGLRPHEVVSSEDVLMRIGVGQPLFEYILADDLVRPCWDVDSYVPEGGCEEEHARQVRTLAEDAIRRQLDRWLPQIPAIMKEGTLDLAVASRHGEVDGVSKVSFRFYLGGCRVRWGDMSRVIARCNPKEICYSKSGSHIPMFDDIYSAERHLGIVMCPKTAQDRRVLVIETDHAPGEFLAQNVCSEWGLITLPTPRGEADVLDLESEDGRATAVTETTVHAAPMGISRETAARVLGLVKDATLAVYPDWLKVMMACHANVTEDLWEVFDERCRTAPGYDGRKNRQAWDGLHKDRTITVRTLFWYAKKDSPDAFRELMHDLRILHINSVAEAYQTYGATESALAASSAALFPRFRFSGKQWFEFRSPLWVAIKEGVIRKHLMDEVQPAWVRAAGVMSSNAGAEHDPEARKRGMEAAASMLKLAHGLFTNAGQIRVEAVLRVFCLDADFEGRLNTRPELLAFDDHVWDWTLHDGRGGLRAGQPEDYLSMSTGYGYPSEDLTEEESAVLHRFLESIYPHGDVRQFMIGMIWRCLDGRTPQRDHNMFLLTGVGGNGKSVFLNFVHQMLGNYAYKAPISMFCQKRAAHTAADDHMLSLMGRRLVYASEPDRNFKDRLNGSLVKELTGGEVISARALYGSNVHFRPQFFLVFMFNENLDLDGRDGGLARRIKVVRHVSRFRQDITEARPDLHLFPMDSGLCEAAHRLAPKFMRLLLESAREDVLGGVPERVRQWTESYLGEQNVVKAFVRDQLTVGTASDHVTLSELRDRLKGWARENGMEEALRAMKLQEIKTDFEKELGDCLPYKKLNNKLSKNVFVGWTITSLVDNYSDEDD